MKSEWYREQIRRERCRRQEEQRRTRKRRRHGDPLQCTSPGSYGDIRCMGPRWLDENYCSKCQGCSWYPKEPATSLRKEEDVIWRRLEEARRLRRIEFAMIGVGVLICLSVWAVRMWY